MKGTKKIAIMLAIITLFAMSTVVYADPVGLLNESVTVESSGTRASIDGYNISAIAGNVTELTIDAITVTNFWQGYYGNVTGTIVLADSNNNTLYDWNVADATGEVYASRSNQISWASIDCANTANITAEDAAIGSTGKTDAINETFTTGVNSFYVGTVQVTDCDEVNLHNATGDKETDLFSNVILADGDGDIVYTSILNNDATGFDNRSHDFQMIVAENGTNSNTVTTPYYFWVELA